MLALLLGLALANEPIALKGESPTEVPATAKGYHYAVPLIEDLLERASTRPGAVRTEVIGHSWNGRSIVAFHVSEPQVEVTEKVLIFAGIHALEWIGTEVAAAYLDELMALPPKGTQVTVIPLLNPGGRARVETDLLDGHNTYRRGNAVQADLNRDYAHNREAKAIWRHVIPGYYRTAAEAPLSQPESKALDALCGREGYDRAASLHAFGGYFYHPWSGDWRHTADHAAYVHQGRQMEAAQGAFAYRTRQLSRWGFFFRAQGTELDHLYAEHDIQAWLIEMTRSGFDIRRPRESLRSYFRWYNPTDPTRHRERGVAALRALTSPVP